MNRPHPLFLYLAQASQLALNDETVLQGLSAYSREKVMHKQSSELRNRSLAAHALLDWALRKHFEVVPGQFSFHENAHGKPHLLADGRTITGFNLSHSADFIAVAIGPQDCQIGVDCETREKADPSRLIQRFLAPAEIAALDSTPRVNQSDFLATWTRKEAWVKMLGTGMQHGLRGFTVRTEAHLPDHEGWIIEDAKVADAQALFTGSYTFERGTPVALACNLPNKQVQVTLQEMSTLDASIQ